MPQGYLITDNWAQAFEPIIRELFFKGAERYPSMIGDFYDVQTSSAAWEKFLGAGAVGTDAWGQYEKTNHPAKVSFNKGYESTFTHLQYPVELDIPRKWIDDSMLAQINDATVALSDSAMVKRETDAANIFNYAFTDTGHTGADGVGLCSLVHPNSPSDTSSVQVNEGTYSLTSQNVKLTRLAMRKWTDDVGGPIAVVPDILLVPPDLEDTALTITNSTNEPSTANNDINPNYRRLRTVVWNYLTDTNAWFLIDSRRMKQSLKWFDRDPLQVNLKQGDTTLSATYIAYMRYSLGWKDWQWIYGNNPS